MQLCTSLQTDNHASTPPLSFYRLDALSAAQPTAWEHWWHKKIKSNTAKANMHLEQNIPQHKMNTAKLVNRSSIYLSRVHLHLQQVPCLTPLQQSWDQALYARLGVQQPAVQCTLTPMYSWKLQIICTVSGTYPYPYMCDLYTYNSQQDGRTRLVMGVATSVTDLLLVTPASECYTGTQNFCSVKFQLAAGLILDNWHPKICQLCKMTQTAQLLTPWNSLCWHCPQR